MVRPIDIQQTLAKVTDLERVEHQRQQHELVHRGQAATQAHDTTHLVSRQVNRPEKPQEARVDPKRRRDKRKGERRKRRRSGKADRAGERGVDTKEPGGNAGNQGVGIEGKEGDPDTRHPSIDIKV